MVKALGFRRDPGTRRDAPRPHRTLRLMKAAIPPVELPLGQLSGDRPPGHLTHRPVEAARPTQASRRPAHSTTTSAASCLPRSTVTVTVTVTATVTTSRRTQLLQLLGLTSIPVTATATAEAVRP